MDIAVIGMSCRFPEADSTEEFWNNLINGKNSVRSIPKERWYMSGEGDLVAGFLKCPLDEFDSNFFNISPKEAPYIDPQQRLFLEVSWESLENAGIPPTSLYGSATGVYLGIGSDEYFRTQLDSTEDTMYKVVGNAFSASTGRLSYFLNLNGPSIPIESTCASSAVAIHSACTALKNNECNLAIAGGVNVLLETSTTYPSALTSESCRSFDSSASGFAPAEGCGVIVLKLLTDAVKDKNNILGVIRGSFINHTGRSSSFGTPNPISEINVLRKALENACVKPDEISYIEAHAGGTAVGDPIEVKAISEVYGGVSRESPLVLGAFKTNIGHPLAAAGVCGVIKMLLCMKNNIIPQNLHLKKIHPDINLNAIPAVIPVSNTPWPKSKAKKIGAVNCFGITGTNVHLIIEQGPEILDKIENTPSQKILTLSAKDDVALESLRVSYKDILSKTNENISDITFTANVGRSTHAHRIALVGSTNLELSKKLEVLEFVRGNGSSSPQPITFMFTGHGCQYYGMAKELYNYNVVFKEAFDRCDILYKNNLGIHLSEFLWGSEGSFDLTRTKYSQPAIFSIEYCLYKLWLSLGVKPDRVIGHSIGEFCAAVASNLISFEDGMKLVCIRSILVDSLPESRMLVLGCSEQKAKEIIGIFSKTHTKEWIDIACENSNSQIVVSTQVETAQVFKIFLHENFPNVRVKLISSQHAFHSRAMDEILDEFQEFASEVNVNENGDIEYVSSLLARKIEAKELDSTYWRSHCRNKVEFLKSANFLLESRGKIFIEVSPEPVLLNLLLENNTSGIDLITCPSLKKSGDDWNVLLNSLAKVYVNSGKNINFSSISKGKIVNLPFYQFNKKKCWASGRKSSYNSGPPSGKVFHSLIGRKINLASELSTESRFFSYISSSSTGYVHDHVIVGHVVVPAACYLEILLNLAQKEYEIENPIIEDLQVLRALNLNETEKQIQIKAVRREEFIDVEIYSQNNDTTEWLQNCQGKISVKSGVNSFEKANLVQLTSICSNDLGIDQVYKRLSSVGIHMGPLFKSIQKITTNDDKSEFLLFYKSVKTKKDEFSCHPIILDAMIQSMWESKMCKTHNTPFALPIGINKFVWFGMDNSLLTEDLFFHIQEDEGILYNSFCEPLAHFQVLTVQQSTTSAFLKSISALETLPQFMTCDYTKLEYSLKNNESINLTLSKDEVEEEMNFVKNYTDSMVVIEEEVAKLSYFYILKALLEIGNTFNKDECFNISSLVKYNTPQMDLRVYKSFMRILEEENIVKNIGGSNYSVLRSSPTLKDIDESIKNLKISEDEKRSIDYNYIKILGENLTNVLRGELSPIELLFSNPDMSIEQVYRESKRCVYDRQLLARTFEKILKKNKYEKIKILEIGAGTGSATSAVLDVLENYSIDCSYTYTDISPTLISEAKNTFSKRNSDNIKISYQVLDIEKDPKIQGIVPHDFDIIIALQVLHATENLKTTLKNVRHCVKKSGFLFLTEIFNNYRDFSLSFDLLKSYWRMTDSRDYVSVNSDSWLNLLSESGFENSLNLSLASTGRGLLLAQAQEANPVYRQFDENLTIKDPSWIIFGKTTGLSLKLKEKLNNVGRNSFLVVPSTRFEKFNDSFGINSCRISDFQQLSHILKNHNIEGIIFLWSLDCNFENISSTTNLQKEQEKSTIGFLNLLKMKISNNWSQTKVFCVTSGAEECNPSHATLCGLLDTYCNEYSEFPSLGIDLDINEDENSSTEKIFSLLWSNTSERYLYFKNEDCFAGRVHSSESDLPALEVSIPSSEKYKLTDATTFKFEPMNINESDSVEVSVRAIGLNFRDILLSSSLLETNYPNSIGLEFSGIVTNKGKSDYEIGDRVVGLTSTGALASHVVVKNPELLFKIPDHMSFASAATLPVAYGTCYLAFIELAKLKAGQKVLIHTGSGGVGLAGIQLAKYLNAEIFLTAGTEKKRKYLRDCLGIKHVYNSRTLNFKDEILRDTEGLGVDVILNTITGVGFKEASIDSLKNGGKFIELSKLNIWSEEDVRKIRPDVEYTVLDAFDMIVNVSPPMIESLKGLCTLFNSKKIDSLPYTPFPLAQTRSAFKFFHGYSHIGKIVIEIPKNIDKINEVSLINQESTYLVTGGIGGLGFVIGSYLAEFGGNVVLTGRSKASEDMEKKINSLGPRVKYVQCDVGDYEKCKELLNSFNYPLRGVFHCAGVFSNGFIVGQTQESFSKSFQPKVYGTYNLHMLTKHLPLDHFVVFSSIAAIMGSTGLGNYSASNRFMDSLINYRVNQCGLPGITINWGPWAEVGTAADYVSGMFKSFYHFSPEIGIVSMERAMRLRLRQIIIADMEMNIIDTAPRLKSYLSELKQSYTNKKRIKTNTNSDEAAIKPSDIIIERLSKEVLNASSDELLEKMQMLVETIFRIHSGLSDSDVVDRSQPLALMGMDSLIGMEMRLRISKLLDISIPTNAVQEHNSVDLFSKYLAQIINPNFEKEAAEILIAKSKKDKMTKVDSSEIIHTNGNDNSVTLEKKKKNPINKFVTKQFQKLSHHSDKKNLQNVIANGSG